MAASYNPQVTFWIKKQELWRTKHKTFSSEKMWCGKVANSITASYCCKMDYGVHAIMLIWRTYWALHDYRYINDSATEFTWPLYLNDGSWVRQGTSISYTLHITFESLHSCDLFSFLFLHLNPITMWSCLPWECLGQVVRYAHSVPTWLLITGP